MAAIDRTVNGMKGIVLALAGVLLSAFCSLLQAESLSEQGYIERLTLGDGRVVVVAEGRLEPRSIGSFAVRLYSGANPAYPYDDFIDGVIYPREGVIRDVELLGEQPDLIRIEFETVGSGDYRNYWQCGFVDNRVFCQPAP